MGTVSLPNRPQGRVNRRLVQGSTALAGLTTIVMLLSAEHLPHLDAELPMLRAATSTCATVAAAVLALTTGSGVSRRRLRWAATGMGLVAVAMWLQTIGFPGVLPHGGPLGTTGDGVLSLYFGWHLAISLCALLACSSLRDCAWLLAVVTAVATGGFVWVATGDLAPLTWLEPDLDYRTITTVTMWVLAAMTIAAAARWSRAAGPSPLWTEAAVTATLVLMGWDVAVRALGSESYTAWWWSSLVLRVAGVVLPLGWLLRGVAQQHRAMDGYADAVEAQQETTAAQNVELSSLADALGSYAGLVAHDLRSPLTVSSGLVETVLLHHDISDQTRLLLDRALLRQRDQAEMITSLLRLARARDGAIEPEQLALSTVVEEVAATAGMHNIVVVRAEHEVLADPAALRAMLQNLITNAVKHSPKDWAVKVTVFSEARADGRIAVHVDDNGPGVPPAERDRVLEPFRQADSATDGVGLGLSIVANLALRHEGRLEVDDAPGGGARFTFDLPPA